MCVCVCVCVREGFPVAPVCPLNIESHSASGTSPFRGTPEGQNQRTGPGQIVQMT